MKYDLVFEGGGAKGMVFAGAMQEFEARGHTFERLLGTSAGAITATSLAAGYTSQEMLEILTEEEGGQPVFVGFLGTPPEFEPEEIRNSATRAFLQGLDVPILPDLVEDKLDDWLASVLLTRPGYRNLFSFIERGGWFSAHKFLDWMRARLDSGTVAGLPRQFGDMTLAEFFAATQTDLSLVVSDTTAGRLLVLNHRTAPDCPLVWAVRMSMSVPLLWPEVEWQAGWGTYRDEAMSGHLIVDGGMLSNFPIELLVSEAPQVTAVMGPKRGENVLGFLIDESLPVPGAPAKAAAAQAEALSLGRLRTVQRLQRLINTMTQAHDKMVIEAFEDLVVRLPAGGYGTIEFDMSDPRREALVAAGRAATRDYFARPAAMVLGAEAEAGAARASHADRVAARLLAR